MVIRCSSRAFQGFKAVLRLLMKVGERRSGTGPRRLAVSCSAATSWCCVCTNAVKVRG